MRRTILITSCLVALCIAGLAVWLCLKKPGQGAVAPRENSNSEQADGRKAGPLQESPALPKVFELPVRNAFLGDHQFSPCYVDLPNRTLYPWKGVVLRPEQVPNVGENSRSPVLAAEDFTLAPIEAPVKYQQTGAGFRPGYLDRTTWMFYAWKSIVLRKQDLLDKSQDGRDAIVKPAFPSQVIGVIEIDMPAYLKDHPELWKKS